MCRARTRRLGASASFAQPDPIRRGAARHTGRGSRRGVGLHRGVALPTTSGARPAVSGRPVRGRDRSGAAVSQGGERPVVTSTGITSRWHRKERGMNTLEERIAEALQRHGQVFHQPMPKGTVARVRGRQMFISIGTVAAAALLVVGAVGVLSASPRASQAGSQETVPPAVRLPASTPEQRRRRQRPPPPRRRASGSRTATPHPTTRTARCPTPAGRWPGGVPHHPEEPGGDRTRERRRVEPRGLRHPPLRRRRLPTVPRWGVRRPDGRRSRRVRRHRVLSAHG